MDGIMVTPAGVFERKGREEAITELKRCAGTQFDQSVIMALEHYLAARPA